MTSLHRVLFAKIRVSCQTFKIDIERSFFNPPFLTIWKSMERSEIMFSHQKSVKKPIFYMTSPQGVLLCWIRVSCQTFKIDIERSFFKPPFLTIWKSMERSEIMFSHQKSVKKPIFYMTSPQGVLLCWIRVSCQTFKIDIERSFFKPPIFDHLKINGKVRNHVFSSEECKKAFFSIWPLPRESCFAKIRVSCQTFIMDIERSFFKPPHFWPF